MNDSRYHIYSGKEKEYIFYRKKCIFILFCYIYNMLKLPETLQDLVGNNPFLQFGMHYKLLNLSSLSVFLQPYLEARLKKQVSKSSVLMGLSRLQKRLARFSPNPLDFEIKNITVHSNLSSISYSRSTEILHTLEKAYKVAQKKGAFMTIAQGMNEITILLETGLLPAIQNEIPVKPKLIRKKIASLGVQFDEKYLDIPGLIYVLIQSIELQNINIIEISSTYTEMIFYLDEKDIRLAMDTMYNVFLIKDSLLPS